MDLKAIIERILKERLNDSDSALKNIASSEKYFRDAYEGRFLFELIQNVRDANKESNTLGSVFIEIHEDALTISNTGAPFNERGVNSVTTIGDSTKESQDFIGFKGIGFKSVQEVSENPSILTNFGTIVFDRERSKSLLPNRQLKNNEIPLFFLPHFEPATLTYEDRLHEYVTKILLPFKEKINSAIIEHRFDQIGIHQILLLGHLSIIHLQSGLKSFRYNIVENEHTKVVTIHKNDTKFQFKHFKPQNKIPIPASLIDNLEDKEKEIFSKDPFVEISLVFDLDGKDRLKLIDKCKLYLFYPTEITSGFPFIIHSYFIVTPDRKGLRDSPLNKFILEKIAEYLSGEWLRKMKTQNRSGFIDFLVFERNNETPILNSIYDRLVATLKNEKFIFDSVTRSFFRVDKVIVAGSYDKGLFPENQLNGKQLVYINSDLTRNWLIREFKVEYLNSSTIQLNIEKECIRQRDKKNFAFFEYLYRYMADHPELNLLGRNVLLTNELKLLNSNDYVFYGLKDKLTLPPSILKRINFLHSSIKISEQRQGKDQTGLIEFSTELLVNRLIKLYDNTTISKLDILISFLRLHILGRVLSDVRQKVLLPTKVNTIWQNALNKPVYIENEQLILIYPQDRFVDLSLLEPSGLSSAELKKKLIQYGAWEIPAIYFDINQVVIPKNDERFSYIYSNIRNYATNNFYLNADWKLDLPEKINEWFSERIISNWKYYVDTIEDANLARVRYGSQTSDWHFVPQNNLLYITSFVKFLKNERWIKIENKDEIFRTNEVTGIDPIEAIQPHSTLFNKYLNALPIHYTSNLSLIQLIGLAHLDTRKFSDFIKILSFIYQRLKDNISLENELIVFFNKILSKLFDLYIYIYTDKEESLVLKDAYFLAKNEFTNKLEWKQAKQIYYIDDKPSYEVLPSEIKSIIQPHFTNRDKNRFGQIGKKIGLDFRKTIEQKLLDIEIIREAKPWDWFPLFFESLALVEILIETNLDSRIPQIKDITVVVCKNLEIDLYKDKKFIVRLENITHKISPLPNIKVYINDSIEDKGSDLFSNIFHDLLVELLGRDLHTIRLQLNDFFSRRNKKDHLKKYEVSPDRIDELAAKIKGTILSRKQSFWIGIVNLKKIANSYTFIRDNSIDFDLLLPLFGDEVSDLKSIAGIIDYEKITAQENIGPIQNIFEKLQVKLNEYNAVSQIKVDFKDYFQRQINGLKNAKKLLFQSKLYEFLGERGINEKERFQDMIDEYELMQFPLVESLLFYDCNEAFTKQIQKKFPGLDISQDEEITVDKRILTTLYKRRLSEFKKAVVNMNHIKWLDDFININKNRSLFYFENTNDELVKRFNLIIAQNQTANGGSTPSNKIDLSKYFNSPNTSIESPDTENIGAKGGENGARTASYGHRIDGGKTNSNQELIGMVSEKVVYDLLKSRLSSADWISKNAAKADVNPEGSDEYNCDITYIDVDNQKHYIEVKGKIDDKKHFYISYSEYIKALKEKENYHLYLVLYALDNAKRRILNLNNIFILDDENDELFNNTKFSANFNSLEIRFK